MIFTQTHIEYPCNDTVWTDLSDSFVIFSTSFDSEISERNKKIIVKKNYINNDKYFVLE